MNNKNKNKYSDFNKLIDYFFAVQAGLIDYPITIAEINKLEFRVIYAIYNQTLIANQYSRSARSIYFKKSNPTQSGYCFSPNPEKTDFTGEIGQQLFYFLMNSFEQQSPRPEIIFEEHPPGRIFRKAVINDLKLTNVQTQAIAPIEIKTAFISDNKSRCNVISTKEGDFIKHKKNNEKIYMLVYVKGDWLDFKSLTFQIFAAPISFLDAIGREFFYLSNPRTKIRLIDIDDLLQDSKYL